MAIAQAIGISSRNPSHPDGRRPSHRDDSFHEVARDQPAKLFPKILQIIGSIGFFGYHEAIITARGALVTWNFPVAQTFVSVPPESASHAIAATRRARRQPSGFLF
jgi:hypothetical protein